MNFSAPLALPSGFTLPSRVILSPMEGVMTPPFVRAANLLKLTDLWLTPFLSVTGSVPSPSVLRKRLLPYTESGLPVIVQLIGRDPDALTECAVSLEQSGIRAVNLNLACPSPTVTAHGAGGGYSRGGGWWDGCAFPLREQCHLRRLPWALPGLLHGV